METATTLATTPDRVVVHSFISDGLYSYEDIPVMLVRRRPRSGSGFDPATTWINWTHLHGGRIWYTPGIGLIPNFRTSFWNGSERRQDRQRNKTIFPRNRREGATALSTWIGEATGDERHVRGEEPVLGNGIRATLRNFFGLPPACA